MDNELMVDVKSLGLKQVSLPGRSPIIKISRIPIIP
jgi:hypothetical protein